MTIIYFKKELPCGKNCHENFSKQVTMLCPNFKDSVTGHISILHSSPHEIIVSCYDKGNHENHRKGKIISTKFNNTQQTFQGTLPTKSELEDL